MRILTATLLLLVISGCANNKEMYYWGEYESLIYKQYAQPGDADPGKQIAIITEDIQKSASKGKSVPPGVHAHLGLMYLSQGNTASAVTAFQLEKKLYPESTTLIDGMLTRLAKNKDK